MSDVSFRGLGFRVSGSGCWAHGRLLKGFLGLRLRGFRVEGVSYPESPIQLN